MSAISETARRLADKYMGAFPTIHDPAKYKKQRDMLAQLIEAQWTIVEVGCARSPVIQETSIKAGCMDCRIPYPFGLDLVLPDQQWRHLVPGVSGLLCPNCIAARAHKLKGATVILGWIDHFDWTAPRPAEWFKNIF